MKVVKIVAIVLLVCNVFTSSSQILQIERQYAPKELLDSHKKTIDSLSKLYKKEVFGYQRSVTMRKYLVETFIIFYTVKGETEDSIVWSRELIPTPEQPQRSLHENGLPFGAYSVYYNGTYIGFIKNGLFTRVTPQDTKLYLSMGLESRKLVINQKKLDEYLKEHYGAYYVKTVNPAPTR